MKILASLWARLEPPGPVALGKSDRSALQMREFGAEEGAYTWEDWEEEVKEKFPVRFWITHTFVRAVTWPIKRRVGDALYWLKCHLLRSHRYHLLDLRNPGPNIPYNHGWLDMTTVILYASFVALRKYVEEEKPKGPKDWATPEEMQDEGLQMQQRDHEEALALYDWWMNGRLLEEAEEDRLFQETKKFVRGAPEHKEATDAWLAYHRWREGEREDEMLQRLIAIRHTLWT